MCVVHSKLFPQNKSYLYNYTRYQMDILTGVFKDSNNFCFVKTLKLQQPKRKHCYQQYDSKSNTNGNNKVKHLWNMNKPTSRGLLGPHL